MRIAFRLILLALTMAFAGAADALGNMRNRTEGSTSVSTMNYDATNRVSTATILGTARTFAYDARGNVANNGNYSFVYDLLNQPVSQAGAVNATFAYDGNLKRVKEVRGGKTIYTVYSRATGGLIYRDQATDVVKTDYVSVGGAALRLKKIGTGPLVPEYTHFDLQGSAVAATDAAGAVLWRESYRPYGRSRLDPPANDNNTGYTGHLVDKPTGLVYMQARYYDPAIGRFLSTDPIGYQDQLNLYAYVGNDPVNKVDPTGEYADLAIEAVSIGLGVKSFFDNLGAGNLGAAAVDAVGVAVDTVLAVVPVAPGAAGIGIRAVREGAETATQRGVRKEAEVLKDMGLDKNTTKVSTSEGNSVPDALTETKSVEVKDTARVSATEQVRIQTDAAAATPGRESVLVTGTNTKVSGPAEARFDQVIRRDDLGPQ